MKAWTCGKHHNFAIFWCRIFRHQSVRSIYITKFIQKLVFNEVSRVYIVCRILCSWCFLFAPHRDEYKLAHKEKSIDPGLARWNWFIYLKVHPLKKDCIMYATVNGELLIVLLLAISDDTLMVHMFFDIILMILFTHECILISNKLFVWIVLSCMVTMWLNIDKYFAVYWEQKIQIEWIWTWSNNLNIVQISIKTYSTSKMEWWNASSLVGQYWGKLTDIWW